MKARKIIIKSICLSFLFLAANAWAQTTAFNYQGRLTEGGNPANGAYQMQFKLFDALSGGSQVGNTISDVPITATNGVFSTKLDFGSNALNGANRWLEIAVRRNSGESYVTLAPREQINSSPFAVRTLSAASADNALNLGGVPASEYVTNSSVGSMFIRNGTTLQTGNFNISGNGFIGGFLGVGTTNPFSTLDVRGNLTLETGISPILYTSVAGTDQNRYLNLINSPSFPSASGLKAGGILVSDSYSFANPGKNDLIVKGNVGIGLAAPQSPLSVRTDNLNYGFTHTNGNVTFGSYIDAARGWFGTRSNHPLSFFTNNGSAAMTIETNGGVGIGGINQGGRQLEVVSSNFVGIYGRSDSPLGGIGVYGTANGGTSRIGVMGEVTNGNGVRGKSETGSGIYGESTSGYAGYFAGRVRVGFTTTGIFQACYTPDTTTVDGTLALCSSSFRYKKDFLPFADGLSFINQLRPLSFRWKSNDMPDIGFGAEDVAKINPLFVTYNQKGEVEGVKYDRLSVVFVNAFKEQQRQIERQSAIIKRQQKQIDALIKLNCLQNPRAEICREELNEL